MRERELPNSLYPITFGLVFGLGFLANGRAGAVIALAGAALMLAVDGIALRISNRDPVDWIGSMIAATGPILLVAVSALGIGGEHPFDADSFSNGLLAMGAVGVIYLLVALLRRRTNKPNALTTR